MSDNASTATGRANGWNESLKYEFALRLLAMYRDKAGNQGIEWSKVKMEGRTTKALTGVWTKMAKEIADMDLAGGAPMGSGAEPSEIPSAGGESSSPKTPKKRGPKSQTGSAKKAKKEEPTDDLAVKKEEPLFENSDDADTTEDLVKEKPVKGEI